MNLSSDQTQDTPDAGLTSYLTEYAKREDGDQQLRRAYGRYVPGSAAREARNWMWTHDDWWEKHDSEPDEGDETEEKENDDDDE